MGTGTLYQGLSCAELSTSKVDFSLLLKSMRMVIWKVETCRMCFLVLEPVTWAPPTPTSDPSSFQNVRFEVLLKSLKTCSK